MHLVVQIPCYNEADTIGSVVADIRSATACFEGVTIVIIDDGSTDGTDQAAKVAGADYVAKHYTNAGLAAAFMTGLAVALNLGADIIVNTDGDNQYAAKSIPRLLKPILDGRAEIVVGTRPISDMEHFAPTTKLLQRIGSWTMRLLSATRVEDATSGFRAISREAALRLNTFSQFTYTLETLIQAGRSGIPVLCVPVETNPPTRPSRLYRSVWHYVLQSSFDMLRMFAVYAPMRTCAILGAVPIVLSLGLCIRYLVLIEILGGSGSRTPSLIAAAILATLGFVVWSVALVGDLLSINRRLLEEIRTEQRRETARLGRTPSRHGYELIALSE